MKSAGKQQVDILLPDVEDSVQPLDMKPVARNCIVEFVATGSFEGKRIFPRINGPDSGELLKDLDALVIPGVDGFMYPKAQGGKDIYFFDQLLLAFEKERGFAPGSFKMIPLIETASAVLNAREICEASNRVVAVAYGCEDFITDLRGIHDANSKSLFVPRAMIAMAARAARVVPVDTVHIDVKNIPDLRLNLELARNLGFEGMLSLHPLEIEHIHEFFSPSPAELQKAQDIIAKYEQGEKNGLGVVLIDNELIGPPMYKDALNIVARGRKT